MKNNNLNNTIKNLVSEEIQIRRKKAKLEEFNQLIKSVLREEYNKTKKSSVKLNQLEESLLRNIEEGAANYSKKKLTESTNLDEASFKEIGDKLKNTFSKDAIKKLINSDKFKQAIARGVVTAGFLAILLSKGYASVNDMKSADIPQDAIKQAIEMSQTEELDSPDETEGDLKDVEKLQQDAPKETQYLKVIKSQPVDGETEIKISKVRGDIKNVEVTKKAFGDLDPNKDTEKLEMAWRLISDNVNKALSDGTVKVGDKVIATNIHTEKGQDGTENVVFDFVFENPDSKDYTDGKTPVKKIAGKIEKGTTPPPLATYKYQHKMTTGTANSSVRADLMSKEVRDAYLRSGWKTTGSGKYLIMGNDSFWANEEDLAKLLKSNPKLKFDNEPLNKYRNEVINGDISNIR